MCSRGIRQSSENFIKKPLKSITNVPPRPEAGSSAMAAVPSRNEPTRSFHGSVTWLRCWASMIASPIGSLARDAHYDIFDLIEFFDK